MGVWKRAAIYRRGGFDIAAVISGVCGHDSPISGMSTALVALSTPERRYEPKMALFRVEKGPVYALIAAISGRMPMMFMTRVRL